MQAPTLSLLVAPLVSDLEPVDVIAAKMIAQAAETGDAEYAAVHVKPTITYLSRRPKRTDDESLCLRNCEYVYRVLRSLV